MIKISEYLEDFLNLIFPQTCAACGTGLLRYEKIICTYCLHSFPKTNFHKDKDNAIKRLFYGRVKLEEAAAFYFFQKSTKYQQLIHRLKYKGEKEIGFELGKFYGNDLLESDFQNVDVIIPIPLHPSRQKSRGYNQSEWIAMGLAESLKKEVDTKTIFRAVATETQTRKSKTERWDNVKSIFQLRETKTLENKHLLIVDDVITTGSTLEACANTLLQIPNVKISIAALAVAFH